MPSLISQLQPVAADPMINLMLTARADQRPEKIDLGMGIYRDAQGQTPVMAAVKAAEEALLVEESTKAYEGPHGNLEFCAYAEELILGKRASNRTVFAAPGGCGALFIGLQLARSLSCTGRLFVSRPTWPNHLNMAKAAGFEIKSFEYIAQSDGTPDFARVLDGLADVKRGDVVLLQGPCHNPTGTDFSADQLRSMASFLIARGALPFIDVAYQGFAAGVEADMVGLRQMLADLPEAIISYSFSKNFGLYRERTGALILQAPDAKLLEVVCSQTSAFIRASYSMPPSHGPAIVAHILAHPELKAQWLSELDSMRERLCRLRALFAEALLNASGNERFGVIRRERGMFSMLDLLQGAPERLRTEHAIFLPDSGRMNLASLPEARIDELARKLAPHLSRES